VHAHPGRYSDSKVDAVCIGLISPIMCIFGVAKGDAGECDSMVAPARIMGILGSSKCMRTGTTITLYPESAVLAVVENRRSINGGGKSQ
jgi:hypothetical protein